MLVSSSTLISKINYAYKNWIQIMLTPSYGLVNLRKRSHEKDSYTHQLKYKFRWQDVYACKPAITQVFVWYSRLRTGVYLQKFRRN